MSEQLVDVTFLVGEWMPILELADMLEREQQARAESSEPSGDLKTTSRTLASSEGLANRREIAQTPASGGGRGRPGRQDAR